MIESKPENIAVGYPEQEEVDIRSPIVRAFCDYCLSVKPVGDYADRGDFDPFKLRPWLGFIMILEHLPDDADFRYRMYGTFIAAQTGCDMTGRRVSEFGPELGPAFSTFFMKLYNESLARKVMIYAEHTRIYSSFDCEWSRILCPVRAVDATQIVVCNYPTVRQKPLGDEI